MNLLFDPLIEGIYSIWPGFFQPMFGNNEPMGRFTFTAAQKATATKVGVAFLGAASFATGATLIANAWKASTASLRNEIAVIQPPSLQPEPKKLKETMMNPIHILGRMKMIVQRSILPLIMGTCGLAGGAFVFTRFDQLLKAMK